MILLIKPFDLNVITAKIQALFKADIFVPGKGGQNIKVLF